MKADKIECISCGQPMKLLSTTFTVGKRKINKYRIRRFKCPVCDEERTIYADGYRDEELEPIMAVNSVTQLFSQEEKNRFD